MVTARPKRTSTRLPTTRTARRCCYPPSVKGWTSGAGWLNSAGVVERLKAARRLGQENPGIAPRIGSMAFEDRMPESLKKRLDSLEGAERVTFALASPEYQLA